MFWIRATIGGLLLLLGAFLSLAQIIALVSALVARKSFSAVPLIAGVSGVAGLLLLPFPAAHRLWWLPLLLDPGSLPVLAWTLAWLLWQQIRRPPT